MGESRCELLESSSKMFYVIFHQETDPKVKKLFYEIIYCKCGAQKRPVLQGLILLIYQENIDVCIYHGLMTIIIPVDTNANPFKNNSSYPVFQAKRESELNFYDF